MFSASSSPGFRPVPPQPNHAGLDDDDVLDVLLLEEALIRLRILEEVVGGDERRKDARHHLRP
jgi:hypothetical protein